MSLRESEVKTLWVEKICDCGAMMSHTGRVLPTHPPKYPHSCTKCGKVENLTHLYPRIEYEKKDGSGGVQP